MIVHLICNAHLDPAWLWELDEGAAEVLSTFRIAAEFCEETEGFVFNHNEALLYEWVKEYDPSLFTRIKKLVAERRWHIMGGWYLQPDCNMPSGESFVRQIAAGRRFFAAEFGAAPTTAINFDPFGHSRGLVQIMARAGYTSYIHCRPGPDDLELPGEYYRWIGFDGSHVTVARRADSYHSQPGKAAEKIQAAIEREKGREHVLVLWGIGNHGGGPSRVDLERLAKLGADLFADEQEPSVALRHDTPEAFFAALEASDHQLPEFRGSLNPWAPGCYTSQVRIKQRHRELENMLYATEKLAVHTTAVGLGEYPLSELRDAERDLLIAEFHDILPGSAIKPVEEASIRLLDHGLEILSRVRRKLFFALASTFSAPPEGSIPLFAYNASAHPARGVWECEFQPAEQNWEETFTDYEVELDGRLVPSQIEHEESNLSLDWRKKIVFAAELPAATMTRFMCRPVVRSSRPTGSLSPSGGTLRIEGSALGVSINTSTGLVDELRFEGRNLVRDGAFVPIVVSDNEDPWGSQVRRYREEVGRFVLMSDERASEWSGIEDVRGGVGPAVRVIEDGPVRAVVQVPLAYHDSVCVLTYKIPYDGTAFDLDVSVHWAEKNKMLKLSIPTALRKSRLLGQVAYGVEELFANGDEVVSQQWQAVVEKGGGLGLGVIDNGIYGSDFAEGELRLSLLHGPAYSALPVRDRPLVSPDRYHARIDQGERAFSFRFVAGLASPLVAEIGALASHFNERPYLLSLFTHGAGETPPTGLVLSDPAVLCSALKAADTGEGAIVRLFNTTAEHRSGQARFGDSGAAGVAAAGEAATAGVGAAGDSKRSLPLTFALAYELGPHEVRTYCVTSGGQVEERTIIEGPLTSWGRWAPADRREP
ncbi:MAG: glycoside hydrolase family 38 C-terminal domain-containing protein [Spirochaetales bacterium]